MKKTKAVIAAALTTTFLAASGLSGCGKVDGTATALTINGDTVTVGTANLMLRWGQAECYSSMANMGFISEGSAFWSSVISEDDDTTYGENFKNSIQTTLTEDVLMRQKAEEYGVSISEEQAATIEEYADNIMEANADVFDELGISRDNVVEVLEFYTYAYLMEDPMTDGEYETEVTDDEAAQRTITYARIYLKESTDDGTVDKSDEEIQAAYAGAEQALEEINASDDPATVDISEIVEAIDEDWYSTSYSYGDDDTYLADAVKEAVETLSSDGEVYQGVIEDEDSGYYYIVRLDKSFDEEATEEKKESILSDRKSDAFEEIKTEWVEAADIETTKGWTNLKVDDTTIYTAVSSSES